jgi:hypothetical protein
MATTLRLVSTEPDETDTYELRAANPLIDACEICGGWTPIMLDTGSPTDLVFCLTDVEDWSTLRIAD